ncbi:hypothetical protein [Kitasatospora sp. GAS1066B]|uniref:hypothetical protein n=1 Tax=Kitasatospora sp. GAS1066B TaxID=3156271 RepID=UPI00351454B0
MPETTTVHTDEVRRVAEHVDALRAFLALTDRDPSPANAAEQLMAVRQAHRDAVLTASVLNGTAADSPSATEETRLAAQTLSRGATLIAEADTHLVGLIALTETFTNPYGVEPKQWAAAQAQIRLADKPLALAAKNLHNRAAHPSSPDVSDGTLRSSARSAAARLRSALVGRPATTGLSPAAAAAGPRASVVATPPAHSNSSAVTGR